MKIIIKEDYQAVSRNAAMITASQVNLKSDSVLGLATGSTPIGMYQELIKMYQNGDVDFSNVRTFNLDEYNKLPPDNSQSYHYFMYENLFRHININPENISILDGMTSDVEKECRDYEEAIRDCGGIDLQILGIGVNGHIGFNEPDTALNVSTALVDLTDDTIKANSRFFASPELVPEKALSVGMGVILKARRIILLASGENKAEAIRDTVNGLVSTQTPSSFLQIHPDVTIIIDRAAASLIDIEDNVSTT